MKACILGAGVIGLTTAWALSEAGYDVTIIDRNAEPAAEASHANGAQLSYSYVAPLASPETLLKLPALLLSPAAPIRIRPTLDPAFIRWGVDFLRACNAGMVERTTTALLALAALSRDTLTTWNEALALDFGLETSGKLVLFRTPGSFEAARRQVERQSRSMGAPQEILSAGQALAREPGLKLTAADLAGGIFTPSEQVGDCLAFCRGLAQHLVARNNITFQMATEVTALVQEQGRVRAVLTGQGAMEADVFVMTMGAGAPEMTRKAGFRLPVYPLKGYSLTANLSAGAAPLGGSVTDFDRKVVYAPLKRGDATVLRIAGIADLVGFSRALDEKRLETLTTQARDTVMMDAAGDLQPWAGLRPATPDGRPVIGWSPLRNLFLNTGHGALGWTLACGSARLAAQMIAGGTPSVPAEWFRLGRRG